MVVREIEPVDELFIVTLKNLHYFPFLRTVERRDFLYFINNLWLKSLFN